MTRLRPWILLVVPALLLLGGGCDLFKELEPTGGDTEGAGDADDADAGTEGGDEPCTYVDDYCSGQDVLESCSPETGETATVYCPAVCGNFLNFTCIAAGGGLHGCWCVEPGPNRLDGCADLEACIGQCRGELACQDRCFRRTDAPTIRLFGALIHCAEADCKPICDEAPEACDSCVSSAMTGLFGDCSVQRSACDADRVSDFPWPE